MLFNLTALSWSFVSFCFSGPYCVVYICSLANIQWPWLSYRNILRRWIFEQFTNLQFILARYKAQIENGKFSNKFTYNLLIPSILTPHFENVLRLFVHSCQTFSYWRPCIGESKTGMTSLRGKHIECKKTTWREHCNVLLNNF